MGSIHGQMVWVGGRPPPMDQKINPPGWTILDLTIGWRKRKLKVFFQRKAEKIHFQDKLI